MYCSQTLFVQAAICGHQPITVILKFQKNTELESRNCYFDLIENNISDM